MRRTTRPVRGASSATASVAAARPDATAAVLAMQRTAGNHATARVVDTIQRMQRDDSSSSSGSRSGFWSWFSWGSSNQGRASSPATGPPAPQPSPQAASDRAPLTERELETIITASLASMESKLEEPAESVAARATLDGLRSLAKDDSVVSLLERHSTQLAKMRKSTSDRKQGKTYDQAALASAERHHERMRELHAALPRLIAEAGEPPPAHRQKLHRLRERYGNVWNEVKALQGGDRMSGRSWRGLMNTVDELEAAVQDWRRVFIDFASRVGELDERVAELSALATGEKRLEVAKHEPMAKAPQPVLIGGGHVGGGGPPAPSSGLVSFDEGARGQLRNAAYTGAGRAGGGEAVNYDIVDIPGLRAPPNSLKRHHILGRRYMQLLHDVVVNGIRDDEATRLLERIAEGRALSASSVFWAPINLFTGPGNRYDDPGSEVERQKPRSMSQPQWDALMQLRAFLDGIILDRKAFFGEHGSRTPLRDVDKPGRARLIEILEALARLGIKHAHPMVAADWAVIGPDSPKSDYLKGGPYAEGVDPELWRQTSRAQDAPNWPAICATANTFGVHVFYVKS